MVNEKPEKFCIRCRKWVGVSQREEMLAKKLAWVCPVCRKVKSE